MIISYFKLYYDANKWSPCLGIVEYMIERENVLSIIECHLLSLFL